MLIPYFCFFWLLYGSVFCGKTLRLINCDPLQWMNKSWTTLIMRNSNRCTHPIGMLQDGHFKHPVRCLSPLVVWRVCLLFCVFTPTPQPPVHFFFLWYHCPPKLSDSPMQRSLHHMLGFHWYYNEMYTQHHFLADTFLSPTVVALILHQSFLVPHPSNTRPTPNPCAPQTPEWLAPFCFIAHQTGPDASLHEETRNFNICRGREGCWGWGGVGAPWPLRGVFGGDRGHVVPQADVTRTQTAGWGAATGRKTCWGTKSLQTGRRGPQFPPSNSTPPH